MPVNRARNDQIWVNFGKNGSFLNFEQKSETTFFVRLQRLGFVQKIRKFPIRGFRKISENLQKQGTSSILEKVKTLPSYQFCVHFSKQKIRTFQSAVLKKIWRTETEK